MKYSFLLTSVYENVPNWYFTGLTTALEEVCGEDCRNVLGFAFPAFEVALSPVGGGGGGGTLIFL